MELLGPFPFAQILEGALVLISPNSWTKETDLGTTKRMTLTDDNNVSPSVETTSLQPEVVIACTSTRTWWFPERIETPWTKATTFGNLLYLKLKKTFKKVEVSFPFAFPSISSSGVAKLISYTSMFLSKIAIHLVLAVEKGSWELAAIEYLKPGS